MEILEILQKSGKDLYPEDLDFFETELATDERYSADYQSRCHSLIKELRAWMKQDAAADDQPAAQPSAAPQGPIVPLDQLAPQGANPSVTALTPDQRLLQDIKNMRGKDGYKSWFKKSISQSDLVDPAFIEKHYAFFHAWELNAIVAVKQLGETFLEKYFGALDHDKIARYQLFSEAFFMKHFSQLDHTVVLQHGKNEWRKKEKRSRQLDVFLRLKGVKI